MMQCFKQSKFIHFFILKLFLVNVINGMFCFSNRSCCYCVYFSLYLFRLVKRGFIIILASSRTEYIEDIMFLTIEICELRPIHKRTKNIIEVYRYRYLVRRIYSRTFYSSHYISSYAFSSYFYSFEYIKVCRAKLVRSQHHHLIHLK
jgi:hypothetical protein